MAGRKQIYRGARLVRGCGICAAFCPGQVMSL